MIKIKKRGSIFSEPFTYIFAILVIALIVYFGFGAVKDLLGFGCAVEAKKFVNDFNDKVGSMKTFSEGSKSKYSLLVPSGVIAICFVEEGADLSKIKYPDIRVELDVLKDAGIMKDNMFFAMAPNANEKCIPGRQKIEKLAVRDKLQCFDVLGGKFTFFLENKGKIVEIGGGN